MTQDFGCDLWPSGKLSFGDFVGRRSSVEEIEEYISQRYEGTSAVLMPSGRSALTLVLTFLGITRADPVWIPPFSSHCVINAVGYVGMPTTSFDSKLKAAVCFHQWGFPKKIETSAPVIEDSVDSLITSTETLFPNNGSFEILSLSKILGAITGGVVLCQDPKDAFSLRKIRSGRGSFGVTHFVFRIVGRTSKIAYHYWSAAEPLNGVIPAALVNNIWNSIQRIDTIVEDRSQKLKHLKECLGSPAMPVVKGRLPVCWPVDAKSDSVDIQMLPSSKRFMLPRFSGQNLKQVYPIPIHQDAPLSRIRSLLKRHDED